MRYVLIAIIFICFSCKSTQVIQLDIGSHLKGYNPCEPSIAISYKDQKNIVAGSILNNYYYSNNSGKSWKKGHLKSDFGVFGDPVIVSDTNGHFYYLHLSDPSGKNWESEELLDRIVCQKSVDGGQHFNNGSYMGLNPPKDQDKQWATVDPKSNAIYATWTQFDLYASIDPNDKSNILFSSSTDGGATWSPAIQINEKSGDCLDGDKTTEGAVPCVGPNGEIYVSWAYNDTIWFDRSTDGGKTWLDEDIFVTAQIGGWEMDIPGIMRVNGMPVTICDLSEGPNKGSIYINYVDQSNGPDDADVWVIKSSDSGNSWSKPIRVNDDQKGKQQFFTWMDVDPSDGNIYCVFYDRRAHEDTSTDVYLAWSDDGAKTFKNQKINEASFTPNPKVFFGDYNDISAVNGIIAPIWTEAHGISTGVYTRIIKKTELEGK